MELISKWANEMLPPIFIHSFIHLFCMNWTGLQFLHIAPLNGKYDPLRHQLTFTVCSAFKFNSGEQVYFSRLTVIECFFFFFFLCYGTDMGRWVCSLGWEEIYHTKQMFNIDPSIHWGSGSSLQFVSMFLQKGKLGQTLFWEGNKRSAG